MSIWWTRILILSLRENRTLSSTKLILVGLLENRLKLLNFRQLDEADKSYLNFHRLGIS
jgi:hypothetical protein